jgi:4-hydroxyphenylpyruvate dioxygenase-like putative hemolysin
MASLVCSRCVRISETAGNKCPHCGADDPLTYNFDQSDAFLHQESKRVKDMRHHFGLEGLVGGLECIIINTEPDHHMAAADELLKTTGLSLYQSFKDSKYKTFVLMRENSADFLLHSRLSGFNPFRPYNTHPKTKHAPQTRLETFVFATDELETYVSIQQSRGIRFMTHDIVQTDNYDFIQTVPSRYTGNSIGFIEWKGDRTYRLRQSENMDVAIKKPNNGYLDNIHELDHTATRVRADDRDAAIIEFMELTSYNFDFAIYVKMFNSITNVARLTADDFAMVFTSGISPHADTAVSGPTETFIHNYGTRVHHMAFNTDQIDDTIAALKDSGMTFLIELVGSPDEGLKQTFSRPSGHTLLVNEYIHRYGGFDGFFTRSNVTKLTEATKQQ